MHIYQKHILDLLRHAKTLRYSELQPDGVESSHFKYHLNQLITDGYVNHESRGVYALSEFGLSFVDKLSEDGVIPHDTPKVITYTLLEDDSHYYLYKKDKEPYRGLLNMVGGKLHVGETAVIAAARELSEKAEIVDCKVSLAGVSQIRITRDDVLFTHVIAFVCRAHITQAQASSKSLVNVLKTDITVQEDLAPDALQLIQQCADAEDFFHSQLHINLS